MNKFKKYFFYSITCFVLFFCFFKIKLNNEFYKSRSLARSVYLHKYGQIINETVFLSKQKNSFMTGGFKNGDYSQGLSYWATTGIFPALILKSKNKFSVNTKDYVSAPCSLQILALEYPCILLYSKQKEHQFIINPWDYFKCDSCWIEVTPNTKFNFSLYHKGSAGPTVKISGLTTEAEYQTLANELFPGSPEKWQKDSFVFTTPENGFAIQIQIQVASLDPGKTMLIDDVSITFENNTSNLKL